MLKAQLQKILNKFGYQVVPLDKLKPVDVRDHHNDPKALNYFQNLQTILIDAPVHLGRGLPLFLFTAKEHPFVRAVEATKKISNSKEKKSSIHKILKTYYENVQPETAAEILGLNHGDVKLLDDKPSWAAVFPWDSYDVDQWQKKHEKSVLSQNLRQGKILTIDDGWAWSGPVSDKKLSIEVNKLYSLLTNIEKNGYQRHDKIDGDITAVVLLDSSGKWCWQARKGQHRASILSGLGYKKLPIRIDKLVFKKDVEIWPNVSSGLFPKKIALKIFDNVFSGNSPKVAELWIEKTPLQFK